jgi:tetratricopeptide (TPR) repeat protein
MEFLLLYGEHNYQMAIATLGEIEHLLDKYSDELENKLFTLLILTLGSQVYLQINHFDKVDDLARRILHTAVKMDDPYFQSVSLNLITTVLINKGEFRKAQNMMGAAIVPTEKTGLSADRASLLNNSAKLELARGDFEKSIKLLEQIYELVSHIPRAQAISAINIAELNILLKENEKAESMIETALLLDKGHDLNLIEPYLLSAWVSIEKGELDKAETFIQTSEKRLEETGETRKIPNINYFKGLLSKRKGDIDNAIEFFEEAYDTATKFRNIELVIKTQFQLVNIFMQRFNETKELADYSSILRYLDNLSFISQEQFIPRLMCDMHLLRGMILAQGGKRERAVEDILKAYDLASKFNYKHMQKEANNLLKEVEKAKKTEYDELKELEEKGFEDIEKMASVLERYEGFKFIKSPKQVETKLQGIAIVEAETALIKYRFITEHEVEEAASIVPSIVAAVNLFSKTVLEEAMIVDEVKEEGTELLIEAINDHIVVAIAEKVTFSMKMQFEKYVSELKLKLPQLMPLENDEKTNEILTEITKRYFEEITFRAGIAEPIPEPSKVTEIDEITVDTEFLLQDDLSKIIELPEKTDLGAPEKPEDLDKILDDVEAELIAIEEGTDEAKDEKQEEAIVEPAKEIEVEEEVDVKDKDKITSEISEIPKIPKASKLEELTEGVVGELDEIKETLEEEPEEEEKELEKEPAEEKEEPIVEPEEPEVESTEEIEEEEEKPVEKDEESVEDEEPAEVKEEPKKEEKETEEPEEPEPELEVESTEEDPKDDKKKVAKEEKEPKKEDKDLRENELEEIPEPELVDELGDGIPKMLDEGEESANVTIKEIVITEKEKKTEEKEEQLETIPEPDFVKELEPVTIRKDKEEKKPKKKKEIPDVEASSEDVLDVLDVLEDHDEESEEE